MSVRVVTKMLEAMAGSILQHLKPNGTSTPERTSTRWLKPIAAPATISNRRLPFQAELPARLLIFPDRLAAWHRAE